MNIKMSIPRSLRWCPPFSWLHDLNISWTEFREKRQQHKERLAKPISAMKYLDHVVIVDGCQYSIGKKKFSSLEKALEYYRKIPLKNLIKQRGRIVCIGIDNPAAPKRFDESLIPSGLLGIDCKDVLCRYAPERRIDIAADLSEVYGEYFELYTSEYFSYEHIFDYGILYGNYPVYTGRELCLSTVPEHEYDRNVVFVPEPRDTLRHLQEPYKLREFHAAYDCFTVQVAEDGTVDDDWDGSFPWGAIPVATFVNIGSAGVYWDCWDKIVDRLVVRYIAYGKEEHLFRFALIDCKSMEIPGENPYYTVTAVGREADGLLPSDAEGCTLWEVREKLIPHAKERILHISPAFDAVYWEEFELQDADGRTRSFCFDYALLEETAPEYRVGCT